MLDSALPPGLELEPRERPEVRDETGEPSRPRRNVLVPVYVRRKSKQPYARLSGRASSLAHERKATDFAPLGAQPARLRKCPDRLTTTVAPRKKCCRCLARGVPSVRLPPPSFGSKN